MSKLESRFKQLVDDLALSIPFECCCASQPQLQGPRSNFEVGGGGGGDTKHFFLLILYNFKNIGGRHVPPLPPNYGLTGNIMKVNSSAVWRQLLLMGTLHLWYTAANIYTDKRRYKNTRH